MYNIMCYGDSNTWGVNTEDHNNRIALNKRWTQVMARELGDEFHILEEGLPGRTTALEDPVGYGRHGEKYLEIALKSQMPIDVLIIMLGTNDLKDMYHVSPEDSSWGLERVILKALSLKATCVTGDFKILVVSPIRIAETFDGAFYYGFSPDSIEKSKELSKYYEKMAKLYSCDFLDASEYARPSIYDGVHIANSDHEVLGNGMAKKIREMIAPK